MYLSKISGGYPSFAKISRPGTGKILFRRRLFHLLKKSCGYPVTWITGPAGSGKTTLAESYLSNYNIPCLWYRIDEGDSDIAAFFYYMNAAVKKILPHKNINLPFLTPEYLSGLPVFTKRYFEMLYDYINFSVLEKSSKKNFYIVFDNYQVLPAGSKFHEILNYGFEEITEKINIIVLSETPPPEQFIRLRANGKIRLIGWDELRFTMEECREVIKMKLKTMPEGEMVENLYKYTEGWAVGLMLLIERVEKEGFNLRVDGYVKNEILNYYAKEIFEKLDVDTKDFLLKTAYLSKITVETAGKLTGNENTRKILNNLEKNNYQFFMISRDFLRERAKEVYTPEENRKLQILSADLLEESGLIGDAAEIMLNIEDWKGVINLVIKYAQSLISQGRNKTLNSWLERIPEDIAGNIPWILFWRGICNLQFNPGQGLPFFEQAFRLFGKEKDDRGVFLTWSAAVQTFLLDFNDFRPIDKWSDWFDEYTRSGLSFASPDIEANVVAAMTGILAWRKPNHPGRKKWLEAAFSIDSRNINIDVYFRACTNSAIHHIWMGEFDESALFVKNMEKIISSQSPSPLRHIIFKLTEAMLYNSSADSQEKAAESVSEGLRIARETGIYLMNSSLLVQGAANSLNAGDLKRTREFLSEAEGLPGGIKKIHYSHYLYFSAWHNFTLKNISQAMVFAQKSLQLIREGGVPVSEILIRILCSHILYSSGDREKAYNELSACKKILSETGSYYFRYLYYLSEAYFAFGKNDEQSGLNALEKAMKSGRQKNYMTMIYFWMPEVMSYLCAKSLEHDIEIEYVQKIIGKLNLVPCKSQVETDNWPWKFRINTLGRFEIIIDGNLMEFTGKTPKKPLLLLKTLIVLGGKDVSKSKLMDILWPETEGDMANISFDTTLNRLRNLLGNNEIIKYKEGKLMIDADICRVDALVFNSIFKQVSIDLDKINNKNLIKKAIDIYRGVFLPGEEECSWINSAREELQNKYKKLSLL